MTNRNTPNLSGSTVFRQIILPVCGVLIIPAIGAWINLNVALGKMQAALDNQREDRIQAVVALREDLAETISTWKDLEERIRENELKITRGDERFTIILTQLGELKVAVQKLNDKH